MNCVAPSFRRTLLCLLPACYLLLLVGCGTPLLSEDEMFERASALCDRGRGAEALQILDQIKEDGMQVGRAFYLKGVAHELNQELEQAVKAYDRCLAKTPEDSDALNNRGAVKYRLGKLNEAEADLTKAIQINPNDDLAWSNLGLTQQYLGKLDDALASSRRAYALRRDAVHTLQLANMLIERNELVEGEKYLDEVLKNNPHLATAYLGRAVIRVKQSKAADATADLELARRYDDGLALQLSINLIKQQVAQLETSEPTSPDTNLTAKNSDKVE